MLDPTIATRLSELFAPLTSALELEVQPGPDPEVNDELTALARAVVATSPRLALREGPPGAHARLVLHRDGAPTGVSFRGVPGGHELGSLVLALLHADGRGKRPDDATIARIRALGPGALRTYVSLDCTSCPDVVQALNLVALLHPGLSHEMVDGARAADEIARLGIRSVPNVVLGDRVVHVGRGALVDLLEALEAALGTDAATAAIAAPRHFDVLVLGGGPAGVSAAIYAARKGLRTGLVAEHLGGQVRETVGIENLIGTVSTIGARLTADLEAHVRQYDVAVLSDRRVARVTDEGVRRVELTSGEVLTAESLIVATGARWRELGVPGEREHVGRGVAFCPHCDGPFYRDRPIAVVGGGNSGVEAALDLSATSSHVTLIEWGDRLRADAVLLARLAERPNVRVITDAETLAVVGDGQKVRGLRVRDRRSGGEEELAVEGVFVQIGLSPNSALVRDLVEVTARGEIVVDTRGRTSRPHVYAAGDVTTVPFKQIVVAMGEGAKAALGAFEDRMRAA